MSDKKNLLSIGDISKLTKASVQSLRYYEQIKLLEPIFVDPDTGYRYYSYDQKCIIEVIQICIELDIPLKKLTGFMDDDNTVNFYDILLHGKEIAEQKLASVKKGLRYIEALKNNVDAADAYNNENVTSTSEATNGTHSFYTRNMPKKHLCILPCESALTDINPLEIVKSVLKLHYDIEDYAEMFHFGLVDIGVLGMYAPGEIKYFMFTELPKGITTKSKAQTLTLPAEKYICTQSEEKQIEQAREIFCGYVQDSDSFIVLETDIFTKQYKINKLVHELRLVVPLSSDL